MSLTGTEKFKTLCHGCSSPMDMKGRKPFTKAVCLNCLSEVTVPMQINDYILDEKISEDDLTAVFSGRNVTNDADLRIVKVHGHCLNVFKKHGEFPVLNFPGAIRYLDTAICERELYVFCERPEGRQVRDYLNGGVSEDNVAVIIYSACRIMAEAANAGVSHGNLSLDSIWVTETGEVEIGDFMIHQNILNANDNRTQIDKILDIAYADTSVLSGSEPSERTDMFSLGICFYHMLTNSLPHTAETAEELVAERKLNPLSRETLEEMEIEKPLITVVMGLLKGEFLCFKEVREFIKHRLFNGEAPPVNEKGRTKVVVKKKNPSISPVPKTPPRAIKAKKPVLKAGTKSTPKTLKARAGTKSVSKPGLKAKTGAKPSAKPAARSASAKNKVTGVTLPKAKNPKQAGRALKKFFK